MIPQHVVEDIRSRAKVSEVVQVVGQRPVKRNGREYLAECPFHADRSPSLTINDDKGLYKCFPCGAKGDVFRFVMEYTGRGFAEAVALVAEMVGMRLDLQADAAQSDAERLRRRAEADARLANRRLAKALDDWNDTRETLQLADKIWRAAVAPPDLALKYLRGRGILLRELPKSMRFHRAIHHSPSRRDFPGIVSRLDGPHGFSGIHRTYLDPSGMTKADVENTKMTLGPFLDSGACLRLQKAGERVALAEGIESALSAAQVIHNEARRSGQPILWPVWSVLALEGFRKVVLPDSVREVLILPDADENPESEDGRPSGREMARKVIDDAIARFQAQGRTVSLFNTPEGMDLNDILRADPGLGAPA